MRALILTCNTGGGHNSAAASLKEAFEKAGWGCDITDALKFISKRMTQIMSSGHNWMYRHAPGVFNFGYQFSEQHPDLFQEESGVYKFLTVGSERLGAYIKEGGYDLVVCTHVFSALMLTEVFRESDLQVRSCFVATDYTCSPSVEESELDWYFVPADSLIPEFVGKGVQKDKLIGSGIPVSARFSEHMPIWEAKKLQGIGPDQKHLLVMCGSMGCGNIKELAEEIAEYLPENAVMTVICGSNESLYRKLCQKLGEDRRVRILGFTGQVSQLMDSADLYLTKAGGLSTSEALNKHLPMCLINAVAGCEEYNARYFVKHGMAVAAEDEKELPKLCIELLADDEKLDQMKVQMARFAPGNSAEKIVKFIINGGNLSDETGNCGLS